MEYSKAANTAHVLGLKTLDMLHLAYAHLISKLEFRLDSFITGDGEILSKAPEIQHELGLTVEHPRQTRSSIFRSNPRLRSGATGDEAEVHEP